MGWRRDILNLSCNLLDFLLNICKFGKKLYEKRERQGEKEREREYGEKEKKQRGEMLAKMQSNRKKNMMKKDLAGCEGGLSN